METSSQVKQKLESWKDHFQTTLNRPEPTETAQILEAEEDVDVNTDQHLKR